MVGCWKAYFGGAEIEWSSKSFKSQKFKKKKNTHQKFNWKQIKNKNTQKTTQKTLKLNRKNRE